MYISTIHTTGNLNEIAPRETWIQSSELLLSCQFILREGEEMQLGLVTPGHFMRFV